MLNEYEIPVDIKNKIKTITYKMCILYLGLWLTNVAIFFLVVWSTTFSSKNDMHDIISWGIVSLSLCMSSILLFVIGEVIYVKTFRNKIASISLIIGFAIYMYIYPFLYICNYIIFNVYICVLVLVGTLMITSYYISNAKRVTINNFSESYYIINNKIFFYNGINKSYKQKNVTIQDYVPDLHWRICMSLIAVAALTGMYAKSFYWNVGFGLAAGLCSLVIAFMFYPFFVHAAYKTLVVIPRIEKKFNQPLCSVPWDLIEQNPDLAEKFWGGPNPVKRPIQYEEVFPKKRSN